MVKDRNILLFATVISALLVFGCIGFGDRDIPGIIKKVKPNQTITNVTNMTNETSIITPSACEDLTAGKEDCIIQRAYNNNRYSDCQLLNGSDYIRCVYKLAEVSYVNCIYIKNSESADDCLVNISAKAGEISCASVTNATKRNACVLQTVNADCRPISDTNKRYVCDAIAKGNESICEKSSDKTGHDNCYLEFSLKRRDVCSQIDSEGTRIACIGLLGNNSGQCAGITSATLIRDNCYKTYAHWKGECVLCDYISDSIYKDDCFVDCALAAQNYRECSRPSEEQKRDNCYWKYAVSVSNTSICDNIKLLSLKRFCIEDVAKALAKPDECELIIKTYGLTQGDVSNCYTKVITLTNVSFTNCQLMNDGYTKDQCTNTAIKRDAMSTDYCAYIADGTLKNLCNRG